MTFTTVICALLVVFCGIRFLRRRAFSALDNIPGPPRKSWITGNLSQYHDPGGWAFQQQLEEDYGEVVKLHGLLGDRELFVFDPTALQSILVQDQDIYEAPPLILWHVVANGLLLGKGIFSTSHDDHRRYRKIMMPGFSTANLRAMVPLFYEVAEKMVRRFWYKFNSLNLQLDMNSILCRTSLELIGRTGIGYSFDPMVPGQEQTDQYARALKEMIPAAYKMQLVFPILPFILKIFPSSFLRFMVNVIPLGAMHELRDIVDLMEATAAKLVKDHQDAMKSAEADGDDNHKNIMSLLSTSCSSIIAFLICPHRSIIQAATDTTSTSMNRMFHLLAIHPDVQEKLHAEILAAPQHLDHDTLIALPYLDGVVHEVLRLWVFNISLYRYMTAVEDTVLPLSKPLTGVNGTVMHSIPVPKGTSIHVAISAANHNKQIWGDDALEFKPQRWTNGKADSVTTKLCGIYGNTMTFIGGGRSCIGFQFAQLEMKVVACVLLRAFKFSAPDARIQWRKPGLITSPNVENRPALPILVERRSGVEM
ncbi:cytochrome P450 [Mycena capillaripes]|nr:cytochrome P450 [Mycena capillaripes]